MDHHCLVVDMTMVVLGLVVVVVVVVLLLLMLMVVVLGKEIYKLKRNGITV